MALTQTLKFSATIDADTTSRSHTGTADCGTVVTDAVLIVCIGGSKNDASLTPWTTPAKASGTATIGAAVEILPRATSTAVWASAMQAWEIPVTSGGTLVLQIDDTVNTYGLGVQVIQFEGQAATAIDGAIMNRETVSGNHNPTTDTLAATPTTDDIVLAFSDWDTDAGAGKGVVAGTDATLLTGTVVGEATNYVQMNGQSRTGSTSTTVTWPTVDGTPATFGCSGMAFIVKAEVITVPEAPTITFQAGGHERAGLEWTAGLDGGSAITDWDIDAATAAAPTTWLGVQATGATLLYGAYTGLSNGTAYVFRVRGVNAIGDGAWSSTSGSATPSDVRGAFLLESGDRFLLESGDVFLLESGAGAATAVVFWGIRMG